MRRNTKTLLLLILGVFHSPACLAAEDGMSVNEMVSYVVQSVCVDAKNQTVGSFPLPSTKLMKLPQRSNTPVFYRKHDWPVKDAPQLATTGHQINDSVILDLGNRWIVNHTFDFGDPPRTFGKFDAGNGDGGQLLIVTKHNVSGFMTEDGGDGIQWFIGPGCRTRPGTDAKFISWIFFRNDIKRDAWTSVVARLNKTRAANQCPDNYGYAFTRYMQTTVSVPFRIVDDSAKTFSMRSEKLPVIISEHYGGKSIESADHLERFYFGKDLGMIRWERWANKAISSQPNIDRDAAVLAGGGRAPAIAYSVPPGPQWRMLDSRTWTMLVPEKGVWKVEQFAWPEKSVTDQLR